MISFHGTNPSLLVEAAFKRIQAERMIGMSMLNPALTVAALGFERNGDDWRGVLLTPWGINLLLLPASAEWPVPGPHERVFRQYPSGTFAFLGNHEAELGDYLACPLIHDMAQFEDQTTAEMTARACLLALEIAPGETGDAKPVVSSSRRKFLTLGS